MNVVYVVYKSKQLDATHLFSVAKNG